MTLAASGAAGETRAQLLGALGFDPTRDAPLEAVAKPEEAEAPKSDEKKEGSVVSLDAFRKKQ